MTEYTNDLEQVERIKKFVNEYGTTILLTVVFAICASFGWQYWQHHQEDIRAEASVGYENVISSLMNGHSDTTKLQANYILTRYANTPYANLAGLILAKEQIGEGKIEEAKNQLQKEMQSAKEPAIRQIARIRVARILINQNQPQQALDLLKTIDDATFNAAIKSVEGDAQIALSQISLARKSYQAALQDLPSTDQNALLLRMKLANLPE